jgi:hypothetical protein
MITDETPKIFEFIICLVVIICLYKLIFRTYVIPNIVYFLYLYIAPFVIAHKYKILQGRRNVGILRWIRWFGVLTICALFIWNMGVEGVIIGALFSVAFIMVANTIFRMYCEIAVCPDGVNGFYSCQSFLEKYQFIGSESTIKIRGYWIRKTLKLVFNYTTDRRYFSWRIFAIVAAFVAIAFLKPLISAACIAILLSLFFSCGVSLTMPIALYLGDSSEASQDFLLRIRTASGIKWVSLLRDISTRMEEFSENPKIAIKAKEKAMRYKNEWSLRMDSDSSWRKVVEDFIQASAVIVLRPEPFGPVYDEIKALSQTDHIQRIIIVGTGGQVFEYLPERLHRCVLSEEEAVHLIAMTASRPKLFKKHMKARF